MDEQNAISLGSGTVAPVTTAIANSGSATITVTTTPSSSVSKNNNTSDSAASLGLSGSSNTFNKICYLDTITNKICYLENLTITNNNIVYVKKSKLRLVLSHLEKIYVFFGGKLIDTDNHIDDCRTSEFLAYHIFSDKTDVDLFDVTKRVQNYINSLNEAEDSSYDSDCDADDQCSSGTTTTTASHSNVSRTVSDTLGQEFAEYVGQPIQQDRSPGYIQRVEFALKLGYTERLVQAALARLGPNPGQNELLAELIKLGAQQGADFSLDSPNSEAPTSYQGSFSNSDDNPSSLSSSSELRPIVIDGSNVAMSHGNKEVFSCRGIKLCVDWFKNRGHKDITVFVPKWRKESSRPDNPIKDQDILNDLERERMLVFTPSRLVGGKRLVCYDDRYILKLAAENDGIVVSNDNYRDLVQESCEFKKVVEERVLMYSFVNDRFMPPDDPLGRSGPTLDNFLRITHKKGDPPIPCPYTRKCTYGNKCKYFHPERGLGPQKSVTEKLSEYAARQLQARNDNLPNRQSLQGKSLSVPLSSSGETSPSSECKKRLISRTKSGAPDCSPTVSFSPASIIEHGKYIGTQTISSKQWVGSGNDGHKYDCQSFSKSHSIENIPREICCGPPQLGNNPNYVSPLWAHNATVQQQNKKNETSCGGSGGNDSGGDGGANLHRKLQRQLTLNPAGCDPRIYQMQRVGQQQVLPPQPTQPPTNQINQQHSPHRPLAPSLSGPRNHHPANWNEIHQNVQRIASAPDPSRPWHSGPPLASSSEPQINLWPQCHMQQQQQSTTTQDQRRRLHYHLASIFPEDQVKSVMQMYPEETNPQKICAAILNMYPKM